MMTKTNNNLTSPPRQRTSVAIQGIDRSTPDDIVADGKCEELHNLRWKDNAWRPVHPHRKKLTLPALPTNYKVVYKHPVTGEQYYIVEALVNGTYYYFNFDSSVTDYTQGLTRIASFNSQQEVSHFGNVLMLIGSTTTHFLWRDNNYMIFSIPPYARTSVSSFSSKYPDATQVRIGDRQAGYGYPWEDYEQETIQGVNSVWDYRGAWFPIHNITQDYSCLADADDYWNGEILLFTTWRMADGTNLSPSPLHLLKSYGGKETNIPEGFTRSISIAPSPRDLYTARLNSTDTSSLEKYLAITIQANNTASAETYAPRNEQFTRRWLPNLRIDIPTDADLSSVTHIAVWATRIHPIFALNQGFIVGQGRDNAFGSIHEVVRTDASFTSFYDKTNLADQPFYLVKETPIEEIAVDGEGNKYLNFVLSASVLANITSNTMYEPNNNIHEVSYMCSLDFNNSLHIANNTTILRDGYNLGDGYTEDDNLTLQKDYISVEVDNNIYHILSTSMRSNVSVVNDASPYTHILSYPDFRAKSIKVDGLGAFTFKPASANNVAWYHAPHTEEEKYPPISKIERSVVLKEDVDNRIITQPNHLVVSSPNNPFSFPFENSYSFGSSNNRILAMQSAAIEMHEMKVGEMPLYVFTEEGIYALIAGSETLYASVAAINYDKIINPNTLAINGAIVYITEKGVHLLTSAGTQVISQPIHDENGMPPLDFLRECKIIWPKQYNEIVLLKEDEYTAYVYNLDSSYWSTRTLKGTKLNTDELYADNTIYDLGDEDESMTLHASILTRPIKLGNVEFKRAETIIPRMNMGSQPAEVIFNINGSVNGTDYMPLRHHTLEIDAWKNNPIVIRRTPFSAKYFEVELGLSGNPLTTAITHIDFEWYQRFRHRMR
ncbi:MAG: hypothetical protein J6C56_04785 [Alistipes sp.]|nr:hypothetical protein [Alistipes sp.]